MKTKFVQNLSVVSIILAITIGLSSIITKSSEKPLSQQNLDKKDNYVSFVIKGIVEDLDVVWINNKLKLLATYVNKDFGNLTLRDETTDLNRRLDLIKQMSSIYPRTYIILEKLLEKYKPEPIKHSLISSALALIPPTKVQSIQLPPQIPPRLNLITLVDGIKQIYGNKTNSDFNKLYSEIKNPKNIEFVKQAEKLITDSAQIYTLQKAVVESVLNTLAPEREYFGWCDCSNAPGILRVAVAARMALDTTSQFENFDTITITSLGAGGLLQEYLFLAALATAWPDNKKLTVNLVSIDTDKDTDFRNKMVSEVISQISYHKIIVNPIYYANHTEYIEACEKNKAPLANILCCVNPEGKDMPKAFEALVEKTLINNGLIYYLARNKYKELLLTSNFRKLWKY